MTYLFTVPEYSKWARTPARTVLNFDPFFVCGQLHHLKESVEFVAVFLVSRHDPFDHVYNTKEGLCRLRISIEILDESGKRTVFANHMARSGQTLWGHGKGYVQFMKRSELEWSSCVCRRDDSITIRCTVFIDVEVEVRKLPAKVFAAEQIVQASKPVAGTTGAFGGGSWYLKVYPNGYCEASRDWVSVFLGRGRSDETETMAEFRFEVIGVVGAGEGEWLRHMFDHDNPAHGARCLVKSSDLTQVEHMATNNDRLVIHCHLRLIKTTTTRLPPTTEPPTAIAVPPSDGLKHHLKVPARLPKSWEKGWMKRRGMQLHC
ncbi:hypothetical protein VPH35_040847 [Triticum aestivum]